MMCLFFKKESELGLALTGGKYKKLVVLLRKLSLAYR